ncbi:MAG TPA: 50S ribosomal protein L29 [Tepidisphaeraceae bacterium]|jgi:large subunit ribosomal protein L29
MKMKEIRLKETDHILHELAEQQKHLFTLRTQSVTEKLEDPSQLGKAKKAIARLKTVLHQRELEAAKTATPTSEPAKSQPVKAESAKPARTKPKAAKKTTAKAAK